MNKSLATLIDRQGRLEGRAHIFKRLKVEVLLPHVDLDPRRVRVRVALADDHQST